MSIIWASARDRVSCRPDRGDLAGGDHERSPLDLGAGDRVKIGADQGE